MSDETLYYELKFSLNGGLPEYSEFQELFDLVSEAVESNNSTKKLIAFHTCKSLAETRFDLLDGTISDEAFASTDYGFVLVHRDQNGFNLWYHPDEDELTFVYNFYKE